MKEITKNRENTNIKNTSRDSLKCVLSISILAKAVFNWELAQTGFLNDVRKGKLRLMCLCFVTGKLRYN